MKVNLNSRTYTYVYLRADLDIKLWGMSQTYKTSATRTVTTCYSNLQLTYDNLICIMYDKMYNIIIAAIASLFSSI